MISSLLQSWVDSFSLHVYSINANSIQKVQAMNFIKEPFVMSAAWPHIVVTPKTRDSILSYNTWSKKNCFLTWLSKMFFLLRSNWFIACKTFVHLTKENFCLHS